MMNGSSIMGAISDLSVLGNSVNILQVPFAPSSHSDLQTVFYSSTIQNIDRAADTVLN